MKRKRPTGRRLKRESLVPALRDLPAPEIQRHAVALYVATGNAAEVQRQLGVDDDSLRRWLAIPENKKLQERLAREALSEAIHKGRRIILESYDQILERLENGDEVVTPKGEIVRQRIKSRDLAYIQDTVGERIERLSVLATDHQTQADISLEKQEELEALYARVRMELDKRHAIEGIVIESDSDPGADHDQGGPTLSHPTPSDGNGTELEPPLHDQGVGDSGESQGNRI